MAVNKITNIPTGGDLRKKTNETIDDSVNSITITDGNIKISKANGTSSTVAVPSNLKVTTTASTQGARTTKVSSLEGTIDTSTTSGSGELSSATYYYIQNAGLSAGTRTLQSLLQELVNRSHTHTTKKNTNYYNCNCNCYYDSCSSSS